MTVYLKRGYSGEWTQPWQAFLAGQGIYVGDYTDNFGPITESATERAQAAWGIQVDGKVGDGTTDEAASRGFDPPWRRLPIAAVASNYGYLDPDYPQPVDLDGDGKGDLLYLNEKGRQVLWGPLYFDVRDGKPVLVGDWYEKNMVMVKVPQLAGVDVWGSKGSGNAQFHRKAVPQLLGAFQDIEDAGRLESLLSFGGTYNMRFIRGSTKTLSNHAFGVALDLNMKWNGLGEQAALVGQEGSVRELVSIFEKWGFYWGGWYRNRKDGMHFECVKRLADEVIIEMMSEFSKSDHILEALKAAA